MDSKTVPNEKIDGIVGPDTGFWLLYSTSQGEIQDNPCYPYIPSGV